MNDNNNITIAHNTNNSKNRIISSNDNNEPAHARLEPVHGMTTMIIITITITMTSMFII